MGGEVWVPVGVEDKGAAVRALSRGGGDGGMRAQ